MAEENVTTQELLEFLQEHMLTKEDGENFATKDDLKAFVTKDDLLKMEERIMERLSFLEREIEDVKESLDRLEKKTQEDDDAMLGEIEALKQRVSYLEKLLQVRQAEVARQSA